MKEISYAYLEIGKGYDSVGPWSYVEIALMVSIISIINNINTIVFVI